MKYNPNRQAIIDRIVCILRIVAILLLILTVSVGRQSKLLAVGNIVLSLSALLLWVFQPQYISEGKEGLFVWSTYSANETDMLLCVMIPPLFLGLRVFRDYLILDFSMFLIVTIAAALVVGIGLLMLTKAQERKPLQTFLIAVMLVLSMAGVCGQLNVALDFSEPEIQRCRVVDHEKQESRGRRYSPENYYWVVETESGEQLRIPVTQAQYTTILKGTVVSVRFSRGALGVPYAYVTYDWLFWNG
jgi:hypothetical protein